jgi:hypothetical protein
MSSTKNLPSSDPETDLFLVRLLRGYMGEVWEEVKPRIVAELPEHIDPALLDKFVDESVRPGIHLNAYGVEPRFYAHRDSRRLLEFYRSK